MICPNCSHETQAASCENCGQALRETSDRRPVSAGELAGAIIGGIVVAVGVGFVSSLFLFGLFSESSATQRHTGAPCWPLGLPLLLLLVLTIGLILFVIPATRQRIAFAKNWGPAAIAFSIAFSVTLFFPFFACDAILSTNVLTSCLTPR